jgi:hypothetical protein
VITAVLGAPGSGKTEVARPLVTLLPSHVVLDWDFLMGPAGRLAGREIQPNPQTWASYRGLIREVICAVSHLPVVLLGVCTPDELAGWPIDAWVLLDCADDELRRRLSSRAQPDDIHAAVSDARQYRSFGLPAFDTTCQSPSQVAAALAQFVQCRAQAGC